MNASEEMVLIDDNHSSPLSPSLAASGIDATGASLVLSFAHWLTVAAKVQAHQSGANQLSYRQVAALEKEMVSDECLRIVKRNQHS